MKIAVLTTSRADWGATGMVVKALGAVSPGGRHEIVPLAMAASQKAHAHLLEAIRADGLPAPGSYWEATMGHMLVVAEGALLSLSPDLLVLTGDRWEVMAWALAAHQARIPIAYCAGGDVTMGSLDDGHRHAITKLSHLHFPTNHEALMRIVAMGEEPSRVHNVGSPLVDRIAQTPLLSLQETYEALDLARAKVDGFIVINWQPETNAANLNEGLVSILRILRDLPLSLGIVLVGQNPDRGSPQAERMIDEYMELVRGVVPAVWHHSLNPVVYLSALKHCQCLVGNSSSGIYEAPWFGTPVLNVGNRQKGRPRARCVMDFSAEGERGLTAVDIQLCKGRRSAPARMFGDGHAARRIVDVLDKLGDASALLNKTFYEVPA